MPRGNVSREKYTEIGAIIFICSRWPAARLQRFSSKGEPLSMEDPKPCSRLQASLSTLGTADVLWIGNDRDANGSVVGEITHAKR